MEYIFGVLNCFGGTLLCQIFSPLFSWGCMTYGICSVTFMFWFIIRLLHVAPMMRGFLNYYELLLLSQVGHTMFGWNKIIQVCGHRLIVGEELLIVWENLDWFLPDVILFPTAEGESLYLRCTVPIRSGFWRFESISLHYFLCDYLRELTDTWCSWKSLLSLKLYMPHYPWNGKMGWFRVFLSLQLILWSLISFPCHLYPSLL